MSSPVVAKEFLWKFRDEITQGVAKARQAMQEAVSTAKEAGMKVSDTGEDWKKMGNDAKEAAQDTSQAVSKAKENAESMKNAAQNAAESIRGQFKKTTKVINGIPKEKVFNLKAKFDDDKLKTFSRKINDSVVMKNANTFRLSVEDYLRTFGGRKTSLNQLENIINELTERGVL